MKANGPKTREVVVVCKSGRMAQFMKAIGKTT